MTYKRWNLFTRKEGNGIVVDYSDPEGNYYSEPFCFPTLEEALSYGRICIDRRIYCNRNFIPLHRYMRKWL